MNYKINFRETIRNLSEEQRKMKGIKQTTIKEQSEQQIHKSFLQHDLIYSKNILNYLTSLQLQEPLTRIFFDVTRRYYTRFEYILLISNIAQIKLDENKQKVILRQNKSSNIDLNVLRTEKTKNLEEKLKNIQYKNEEKNYKNKYSVLLNVKQILTYKDFEEYENKIKDSNFEILGDNKGIYLLNISKTSQEADLIDLVKNIYPTKMFFQEKITKPRRKKYLNKKHRQKKKINYKTTSEQK